MLVRKLWCSHGWTLGLAAFFIPVLAHAQQVAAPFANMRSVGASIIVFVQICGGLYLAKDAVGVGTSFSRGDPQAKQRLNDWVLGAAVVFSSAGVLEWLKRSLSVGVGA